MKTITLKVNKEKAYKKVIQALKELKIKYERVNNNQLFGKRGMSFFSWGEEIQISLHQKSENETLVKVFSTTPNQLFSWGKNEENEKEISDKIKLLTNSK